MSSDQRETPYLDALLSYAAAQPRAAARARPQGGSGRRRGPDRGDRRAGARHWTSRRSRYGIDVGVEPTPFEQRPAARGGGVGRAGAPGSSINGASQGNLAAGLALAHIGDRVVVQRNAHSSTIDALVLSGMRPTFVAPEIDPELGIAHCVTEETLGRALAQTPGAVGRMGRSRRRTSARPRTSGRSRGSPTSTACRWSWTRPGARTWPSTRRCPNTRWRRAPTW